MAESQDLDPRHDPIYQRGYDPAVHGGGVAPSEPESRRSRVRRAVDEELFAPPGAPRRERTARTPEGRPEPNGQTPQAAPRRIAPPEWAPFAQLDESRDDEGATDGQTVVVAAGNDSTMTTPADDDRAASTPPWKNPYLVGLVIGGAVLALVGFQMFRAALETIYVDFAQSGVIYGETSGTEDTPDPTAELVSMQIGWSIGPLLFILGIAAILAVLVFVAVRWRPAAKAPVRPDGEPDGRGPDER